MAAILEESDLKEVEYPELPNQFNFGISNNKCDVYNFFNVLQSPWQQLLIDIREKNKYKEYHAIYTISLPIEINEDDMVNILKKHIEAQQNMIVNIYIYCDDIDNKQATNHYSVINKILKEKFTLFPKMFIFRDIDGLFFKKYPFLCEKELSDDDEDKEERKQEKQVKYGKLAPFMVAKIQKKGKKSFVELYNERIGNHLEYPHQIVNDTIFLGDILAASNKEILQNLCITHIVNCTEKDNKFENNKELNIKYFQIAIIDKIHEMIALYFEEVIEFIHNAIKDDVNNKILIHCARGVSRSATVSIAYLMKTKSMSMDDAIQYVQKKRNIIDPNQGFLLQLEHYQNNAYKINENVLKQQLSEIF